MIRKCSICLMFIFLVGCGNTTDNSSEQDDVGQQELVRYETSSEDEDQSKNFIDVRELQKEELADNNFEQYSDPYTTEESQDIAKELMKNKDVILAEVRIVDEQIFVAVRLRENVYDRNHDMSVVTVIEDTVREAIDDEQKQIIVWTDHIQWNRMKNHHAKPQALDLFNGFFKGAN